MWLVLSGMAAAAVSFACALFIFVHAFRRSVGTGVMVLCIPCFVFYYAFTQFEHPRKGPIVATWIGLMVLAAVLYALALPALAPAQLRGGGF